jgi:hypothetical protein
MPFILRLRAHFSSLFSNQHGELKNGKFLNFSNSKKLFELFSLGQKGIFSSHALPFSQPVALTTNFKKGFA